MVVTLEAALWAVSHEGDWEKGFRNDILTAVNLGSDTDTVAAVAGVSPESNMDWMTFKIGRIGCKIEKKLKDICSDENMMRY